MANSSNQNRYVYKGVQFETRSVPRENLQDVEGFSVRDDDIFLASFPRSGTHWLMEMVLLIMADSDPRKVNRSTMDQILEKTLPIDPARPLVAGYRVYEEWPTDRPRVLLTHLSAEFLPQQIWHKKSAKVIYVARNVLDVLVSQHRFLSRLNVLPPELQDWSAFVQYNMTDEVAGGNWFHHVSTYWTRREDDNLLFLKYEDIKRDHRKTVQKIAEFLERPLMTEQIDRVVELTSFDGMMETYRRMETEEPSKLFRTRAFGIEPFLMKGQVGNWKGKYSDEQLQKLRSKMEKDLGGLGLNFDVSGGASL